MFSSRDTPLLKLRSEPNLSGVIELILGEPVIQEEALALAGRHVTDGLADLLAGGDGALEITKDREDACGAVVGGGGDAGMLPLSAAR